MPIDIICHFTFAKAMKRINEEIILYKPLAYYVMYKNLLDDI